MTGEQTLSEREIFKHAVQLPEDQRAAYLENACGDNAKLRQEVESLLKAHDTSGSFLESPAIDISATTDHRPITEQVGNIIGPYKLLQQIGEGGMGVVFMAEQTEPIQRTVALKIVKPGMDTRQVIARFEAERQALAMMDHPNISRVIDANTTDTGRPYFVMDLVKGVPITNYCDQQHLTVRQRLELFTQVCHAVQHAHQKGIIHRDLKPSNVLVAEYDGKPVPKIIDFGVAKATAQRLTERTMFTQFGQIIGTFEYMSPEQARFNQLDVDTRSDIYSLGVMLYELLAGSTPLEKERLRSAAFDEILRIISEEEPPRPSTRLSSSQSLPSIAANRHTEPARLSKDVRGELDWIVMKCLEKDRNRRYETANGLLHDIERYLHDEPVQACPPSTAYRFRKFARRNKAALFVASAAVAVLLLLVTGLAISNRLIDAERQRAETNFLRSRLAVSKILSQAAMGTGQWSKLPPELRKKFSHEAINFYESFLQNESTDPSLQYETAVAYRALSELHRSIDDVQSAEKLVRQSVDILDGLASTFPDKLEYRQQLAYSHCVLGLLLRQIQRPVESEASYAKAASLYSELISQRPDVVDYYTESLLCYVAWARLEQERSGSRNEEHAVKRLLELVSKVPNDIPQRADILSNIAQALSDTGRVEKAIPLLKEIIRLRPDDSAAQYQLAAMLQQQGKIDEAIKGYQESVRLKPDFLDALNNLGNCLSMIGRLDESIACYSKVLTVDPKYVTSHTGMGIVFYQQRKFREAAAACRKAIELDPKHAAGPYSNLGNVLVESGELDDAAAAYRKAIELQPNNTDFHNNLAIALQRQGKYQDAIAACRKAIELNPRNTSAYMNLGIALAEMEKEDDANAAFNKALALKPNDTRSMNALAWYVATSANLENRDAALAVQMAKRATKLAPHIGNYWNTLGVAEYRAGNWKQSVAALEKAVDYYHEIDAFDGFVLAMAHWKLHQQDKARTCYEQAEEWMNKNAPNNPDLRRFHAEAAKLLGITEPQPSTDKLPPIHSQGLAND